MCVDVGEASSSNCFHMMAEADSSASGHAVKARKPYMITKQRERWTEQEHDKFLEALKQYGRAWRRIEEHIGSKSTVQIRSHAQKFFSKVGRETLGNSLGTDKSIEIPPPRPKRKPDHPYPRKVGHVSGKKGSFVDEQLWSFMPNQSLSGQESKSPTSILTPFEPDAVGTPSFNTLKPCMSPLSSADTTLTLEKTFSEQVSGSKFSQDASSTASDLDIQDPVATQQTTNLKLFGMTFTVSAFHHKEDLEHQGSFSGCENIDMEIQKHQEQDGGGGENNHLNVIRFPSCRALYGGAPFDFLRPLSQLQSAEDPSLKESCQVESSNSGNADRTFLQESLTQPLVLKPSKNTVFCSLKPSSSSSGRGFMPYKKRADKK